MSLFLFDLKIQINSYRHSSLSSTGSFLCCTYHHPNTQDAFVLDFVLESVTLGKIILRATADPYGGYVLEACWDSTMKT